jgi:hypothetical protein
VGTSHATNISMTATLIIQVLYAMKQEEISAVFYWPSKRVFKNLIPFIELAAPGCLMLFLNWLNWEVLVLMAGQF